MRNTVIVLISALVSMIISAQSPEVRVRPNKSVEELPYKIKVDEIKETDRAIEPDAHPESQASLEKLNLMDMYGNKVKPVLGKVTVIEYWTEKSHKENLFWNKMREVERQYEGSDEIQIVSINYDFVRTGKYHQAAMQYFVKNNTSPQTLYLDRDDGFREVFYVPGPVSYILIDHRGQYIFAGRGDEPSTSVLFDMHIENCLKYQKFNMGGGTKIENKQ